MLRKATLALVVGLGLALGLLWLVDADLGARAAAPSWALAQGVSWADHAKHPAGELHVCLSGPPTCNYATVQEAVDNAEWGDVIKVAEGVYTDVHAREGITQVVFINKTVTIRGGYTTTNWSTPYAITQPTTLDAQGRGRVVYVTGFSAHAGLMDLRITGGDGTGLGGSYLGDAAGGIYVTDAATTISNCVIVANVGSTSGAAYGGGVYARYSQATLTGNIVEGNTASSADVGRAGGVYLNGCTATLGGNTVQSNTASTAANGNGGGIVVEYSTAELIDNTVVGNVATTGHIGGGGGIYAESSAVALRRNHLAGNIGSTVSSGTGGGLKLLYCDHSTLEGNVVVSNTATLQPAYLGEGGGLYIGQSNPISLTNNLVAGNHANYSGSGLWFGAFPAYPTVAGLIHTTVADNVGGGQGVYVGADATVAFTNTIVAAHSGSGVFVAQAGEARMEATLWYGNGSDTAGNGTIAVGSVNVYGDPGFADPAALDYHLTEGSAAVDAGVAAGVGNDIDGEPRPQGAGYDIGADEFQVPPPDMVWEKTLDVNAGPSMSWEGGPFPAAPGDTVTVVDRVWVTGTEAVSFTVRETWSLSLLWDSYSTSSGSVSQDGSAAAWSVSEAVPNTWHVFTKSWGVVAAPAFADTVTETLTVEGAPYQLAERFIEIEHPRPQPEWQKTVCIDGAACQAWDAGPLAVSPGDDVTVADRVRITHTEDIAFTVGQVWGPGVELVEWTNDAGTVESDAGTLTWQGAGGAAGDWQALTVTLRVEGTTWLRDAVTETLTVEGASPQPPQRVVALRNLGADTGCYARVNDGSLTYPVVQWAVDTAQAGDLVKLAGTCNDVNQYGGLPQVVYVDKALTLRGGYTTTDWTAPDPVAHPTSLDAGGLGRVVYVDGVSHVDIEGLRITGGDATGLGGYPWGGDAGGGVYVRGVTAAVSVGISNTHVFSSTAELGGGLYLESCDATLSGNSVYGNSAEWTGGGGLYIRDSQAILEKNTVTDNAGGWGGGLHLVGGESTLSDNTFTGNAGGVGGGMALEAATVWLNRNSIVENSSSLGAGGAYVYLSDATFDGDVICKNTAATYGGGVWVYSQAPRLINVVIADNEVETDGAGMYVDTASPQLVHATIARNRGGDGSGIHIMDGGYGVHSSVALTNTIIAGHTVGITVTEGNTATLETTLWHTNGANLGGAGATDSANDQAGDPAFSSDGYHLTDRSAAIDAGLDAGVSTDLDGNARPEGAGFDIGADEHLPRVYLPLVVRSH